MSDSCLGVFILVYSDPGEDLLIIEWISFGPKNACRSQFSGDGISVNQESYSCMFSLEEVLDAISEFCTFVFRKDVSGCATETAL